ncbi:hypothetical protein HUN03_00285 [Mycoplasmopsis anatis]|uniref:hypothetical protein n=1 Tax=Mycoplasmopsis anatis TaxID=171279 RepID=UPI001C4DDED1|nr:hypothetical protein [Mycoplasmopsis anatis]MBW0594697.1 hypothetical protein [Mycoplasmopsis anatis]MBW0595514.1 hypothetical protein [Mycoplasmopsis anatis]MBW0598276.1 hypothetical protein [Mycoplasmopsis anatis]MBW0599127.1 hypothetical protein [Mycoplasmopsis anatis]MBW0601134.1 hypothetical protein [Mycoplasmopsis anatis]
MVAQLTSEIANKKESIKNKEIQLENAFENAKGLIQQIIAASDNQIEYVISLRDKISAYLNKDYTQYATVEFANNIKSSAQRLIDDINSYIRELTIAIEQAKLDYDRALKTKNIQDFTSINIESFGIKNKNLLNEFDSLVNKDFQEAFAKYTESLEKYAIKSKEYNDLQIENSKNLAKIDELNKQLETANDKILSLDTRINNLNQELKEKLINSLIDVNSILESSIRTLEADTVDNSELVNPLKEQNEVIKNILLETSDPEFVQKNSAIATNALSLISDLVFNYQQSRVKPLEGEIVELNAQISKLDKTIETLNKNIETKEELIKQQKQAIAELETEKENLTTQLNNTIEELNQTNSELDSLKVANASLLASQQDELAKVNSKLETLITKSNELLIDSVESSAKNELQNIINSEFTTEIPADINTVNARIKFNTELSLTLINKFNEVLKVNYDSKLSAKISELEQISAQKDEIEQVKNSLENELRAKVAENTSISEELTNLIKTQNTIIENQSNRFDQLVSKHKQLKSQAEELLRNSEESEQKTKLQNKLSETINLDKSQELSSVVEQNNNISDFNISLVGLMKELIKTNYDKQIQTKDEYAKMLNTQLNAANFAKEELNKAFSRVSDEKDELKRTHASKVQELESQLATANAETRRQSQLVAEKEKRIQELLSNPSSSEISRLQSQISRLESEKQSLQSKLTTMTSERDSWKEKYIKPTKVSIDNPPSVPSVSYITSGDSNIILTPYNLTLSFNVKLVVKSQSDGAPSLENYQIIGSSEKDKEIQDSIIKNFGLHLQDNSIYKFAEISYSAAKKLTKKLSTATLLKNTTSDTYKFSSFNQMNKKEIFTLDLGQTTGTISTTSIYKSSNQYTIENWDVQYERANIWETEDYNFDYRPKTDYIYYQVDENQNYYINQTLLVITDPTTQKSYVGMRYTFSPRPSSKTITLSSLGQTINYDKLNLGGYTPGGDIWETYNNEPRYQSRLRDRENDIKNLPLTRIEYRLNNSTIWLNSDSIVLSHLSPNEVRKQ